MKKFIFLTVIVLLVINVKAQFTGANSSVDLTILDTRVKEMGKYADVKTGVPFVLKDWSQGAITVNGKVQKEELMLKYDEVDDELLVKGEGNSVKKFSLPIEAFTIKDGSKIRVFVSGFKPTKNANSNAYYELIADGKLKLLRKNFKKISEYKEYSGATAKVIKDDVQYFVVSSDNQPTPIKLEQKSILQVLSDKGAAVEEHIKANKLNLKKENDVVSVFQFYNKG
ncbi:MAG: hypothetical protein V4546_12895 [Bacteroidota bacterium]